MNTLFNLNKLKFITKNKNYLRKNLLIITFLFAIAIYVIYHLLHGNRGLFALFEIREVVAIGNKKLNEIEQELNVVTKRVYLLHPKNLDIDILEEQIRSVLNMASEDEIIVNTKEILSSQKLDS
jgi:cell division protein FtsB